MPDRHKERVPPSHIFPLLFLHNRLLVYFSFCFCHYFFSLQVLYTICRNFCRRGYFCGFFPGKKNKPCKMQGLSFKITQRLLLHQRLRFQHLRQRWKRRLSFQRQHRHLQLLLWLLCHYLHQLPQQLSLLRQGLPQSSCLPEPGYFC